MYNPDQMKFGRPEELHIIHRAILQFAAAHGGELPGLSNPEHAKEVWETAKGLNAEIKKIQEIFDTFNKLPENKDNYQKF